jgi:hypothetical protein
VTAQSRQPVPAKSPGEGGLAVRAELKAILAEVARRRALISYVELVACISSAHLPPNDPAIGALLGELSADEDDAGRGLLSALVVRQDTGLPGTGFFRMAAGRGRSVDDRRACWEQERDRVYGVWADGHA